MQLTFLNRIRSALHFHISHLDSVWHNKNFQYKTSLIMFSLLLLLFKKKKKFKISLLYLTLIWLGRGNQENPKVHGWWLSVGDDELELGHDTTKYGIILVLESPTHRKLIFRRRIGHHIIYCKFLQLLCKVVLTKFIILI